MKETILTGDRPSGRLHLGHLVGSLERRVQLQTKHPTLLIIADLHLLTTRPEREHIERILEHARGIVLDYLSAGIDPQHVTIFLQSAISQTYELNTLLMNQVSTERLMRIPSIRDMAQGGTVSHSLVSYPVLQATDILLQRATLVPVGQDNLPHIELAQEIARRFNKRYGQLFPRPRALLSDTPSLIGTCGKHKMSKSRKNAIFLSDDPQTIAKKVRSMFTDPKRVRADIPGETQRNPVFVYHRRFNDDREEVRALTERYERGAVGDREVKDRLIEALLRYLAPIRARMARFEAQPELIDRLLLEGTQRAQTRAQQTMTQARSAMGLDRAMAQLQALTRA